MIDYIFTAEFDILKGSLIRNSFPLLGKDTYDETFLSSYMIPDGCHKREYDNNVFKYSFKQTLLLQELSTKIMNLKIKVNVLRYNTTLEKWEPFNNNRNSESSEKNKKISYEYLIYINMVSLQRINFVRHNDKIDLELEMHEDLQFTKLNDNFYSLYSKEGVSFGLNFENKEMIPIISEYFSFFDKENKQLSQKTTYFFYNLVKNKKDDNIKRGSLIRSVALCSKELNLLRTFEPVVKHYLDIYSNMDISKNFLKLEQLLKECFTVINETISFIPKQYLTLNAHEILEIPIDLEENTEKQSYFCKVHSNKPIKIDIDTSYFKNYSEPSLIEFIKKFSEKTMLIYNSILNEEKILFIGYECSIEETCNFVGSCQTLVNPINISDRLYPYEHLLNLDFLQNDGYIAGVSNPIFSSRKQWWSLCCDIKKGTIIDNRLKPVRNKAGKYNEEMSEVKSSALDQEFINHIIKKIKENDATELEVRMHFYEYTKNFLDLCSNSSNLIDFEKDDKNFLEMIEWKFHNFRKTKLYEKILVSKEKERQNMRQIFAEKYLNVNKVINMFAIIKYWDDYELLLIYSTLIDCFSNFNTSTLEILLKSIFSKKYTFDALAAGFFSNSEDVIIAALKCFEKIESLKIGGRILKKFSYYILFVYQNLKNKYMNNKM